MLTLFRGELSRSGILTGKWVYGVLLDSDGKVYHYIGNLGQIDGRVGERTVGQFTGLFDKQERKVFHGDIIELNTGTSVQHFSISIPDDILKIEAENLGLPKDYGKMTIDRDWWKEFKDDITVIGNIWDNADMLTKWRTVGCAPVDRHTVDRFTGLFDKQERKVFHGDIIELKDYTGIYHFLITISDGLLEVQAENLAHPQSYGKSTIRRDWWKNRKDKIRIIGNMYDNPDMLTKWRTAE